jgi:hypothetical protein
MADNAEAGPGPSSEALALTSAFAALNSPSKRPEKRQAVEASTTRPAAAAGAAEAPRTGLRESVFSRMGYTQYGRRRGRQLRLAPLDSKARNRMSSLTRFKLTAIQVPAMR